MEQREWIFYIRCASNEEAETEPDEGFKYSGLTFGVHDDVSDPDWPCYKIVFNGSFDAVMGFIVCFFYKYAMFDVYKERFSLNCGHPEIQNELDGNFVYNQYLAGCIFKRCPNKTIVVEFDGDIDQCYFCTNNLGEYLAGHYTMLSLHIPDVQIWTYQLDEYISRIFIKEQNGHVNACPACVDTDEWDNFSYGRCIDDEDEIKNHAGTNCKVSCTKI